MDRSTRFRLYVACFHWYFRRENRAWMNFHKPFLRQQALSSISGFGYICVVTIFGCCKGLDWASSWEVWAGWLPQFYASFDGWWWCDQWWCDTYHNRKEVLRLNCTLYSTFWGKQHLLYAHRPVKVLNAFPSTSFRIRIGIFVAEFTWWKIGKGCRCIVGVVHASVYVCDALSDKNSLCRRSFNVCL